MFVGHYAAAFVLKAKEPKTSLGMLLLPSNLWTFFFSLCLMGIEELTFVDGLNEVNNFQMNFPYTHGLLATLIWGSYFMVSIWFSVENHRIIRWPFLWAWLSYLIGFRFDCSCARFTSVVWRTKIGYRVMAF